MGLYKFFGDCGRMGYLEGVFVASKEEVDNLIGQEIHFGEVLGKHSDIVWKMEEGEIGLLTEDEDFITKAIEYGIVPTGHNPFYYLEEDDD